MAKSRTHKRRLSKKARKSVRRMIMNNLFALWLHIRMFLDLMIDYMFGWLYNGPVAKITPTPNTFILDSATSLAASIRKGKRSAEETVKAFVDRAKEVNGVINAVTDERYDAALEEAKQIDRDIASGKIDAETFKKKPFLGIPFTTKESTACKGLSYTLGLVSRKGVKASEDADIVLAMKEAGAILIANTNIPEFNLWQETRNNVFGQTSNPYNTTRTTGGSSGGEAALIASCGSAFGLGTDIGGSIRMPAFFCGIFGHKPTSNLISTKGLSLRTGKEKQTMVVAGPMCRHAEDLAPMLKVLIGENNIGQLKLDMPVHIRNLKFFYIEQSNDPRVSSVCFELQDLMQRVVYSVSELLPENEVNMTSLDVPEVAFSSRLWRYWMSQEPSKFAYELGNRKKTVNVWTEVINYAIGQSPFTGAAILKLLDDKLPKEDEKWAQATTTKLGEKLLDELGDNGVLFYPSYTWPASYHYTAYLRPYNFSYWAIFNVLKFPVTQVPLGLSEDGLPIGIQVVAAPCNDHLCIAVAKHLENAFGGYVPPFYSKSPNAH